MSTSPRGGFCLALAAPVPPHALFGRQPRIARLRDSSREYIETARINPLTAQIAKHSVWRFGFGLRELRDIAYSERMEVEDSLGADGNQIAECAVGVERQIF
jgi:hypothetical protein